MINFSESSQLSHLIVHRTVDGGGIGESCARDEPVVISRNKKKDSIAMT